MKRHYPETRHRGSPSVQRDAVPPAQPDEGWTDPARWRVDSAVNDAPSREAMNYALAQTGQRRSPPAQGSEGRTEDPAIRRVASTDDAPSREAMNYARSSPAQGSEGRTEDPAIRRVVSADDAPSREAMNYALPQTASLVKRNEGRTDEPTLSATSVATPVRPETTTPAIQAPPSVKSLFSGASWGTDDWNESVVVPVGKPPQPTGRVAYAWYLAGEPRQFEDYACAILVNAWFIKQNGLRPNADMIAVHFEEVPRPERFEKMGVKLIKVQAAVSRGKWQWLQSFLKLRVASLYQYDRIIYMDADSFPIGSLDNLFDLANFPVEIATPIAYWQGHSAMTGGPVIIDPRRVFYDRDFTGVLDTNINLRDNSEMDWVNRHFKNTISLLPGFYAMLISEFCGKDPTYRYWQKHFGQSARWVLQHAAVTLERAQWLEDGGLLESNAASEAKSEIRSFVAGANGARVGYLTKEGLLGALKELGLAAIGNAEEASDLTRKLIVAKKVHIFRHLSSEQINKLVQSFVLQRYRKGAHVIKQGEVGASFFVIASGDVNVEIDGKFIRTMTKNSYFGERALLFDEPRTATVEVSSPEAELWSIEKSTFSSIVAGKMQQELMHRIRLQPLLQAEGRFACLVYARIWWRLHDLEVSYVHYSALELCKQSPAPDLCLSKKLPDMFANPSTLSSFAPEFQPNGPAPAQFMQNQYYSSSATYQYPGQEQMQQGGMSSYYANAGYSYDCYQNGAYGNAAYTGNSYSQGQYGTGHYANGNYGNYSKNTCNGRARNPRAAAINLDDFSDLSDSDSDAEIVAKPMSEKKVPAALETSSDAESSEDAEPAEEPSPSAADEAVDLLKDTTSEAAHSISSASSEPEEEELGPLSEDADTDPSTVFSLKQMLIWRETMLKSKEEPVILYRTQIFEATPTAVKETAPAAKTPKAKGSDKSKASKGKLEVSENSWAAQQRKLKQSEVSQDPCSQVARTIKCILNKLTLEKFASLSQQLLECGLRTSTDVEVLIHEVFEKATTQHHFIDMYADLCVLLHEHFTAHPFEDCSGKVDGRKMTFKRLLLDECQLSFERLLSPPEGLELLPAEERTAAEVRYKTSMLGNIRLVGGLLSRGMLASRVGIAILEELLSNPTPEALESVAAMLTVLGPTADNKEWPHHTALKAVFDQISTIIKAKTCPARERFLLKDLLDLRAARWVDKRPKKIERAMTLAQVADSAAGRKVEERLIRKVASVPAPAPAFDQEKFREGTKKALVELRHSGCIDEAVDRMKALGVPPAGEQAAEVSEILCFAVQEGAANVRELDFKALRAVVEKGWKKDALAQGAGLFTKDVAPDLIFDVPGLGKILSEELCVVLPEAAEAVDIFQG
ncbi:unnamed protein product [Symbiodinium natans]|uniref:Cyclic nucleotide-binding domain-containing protein n=1 Tax=Symbiodinium natans TaxID=878477 RepID=A0A812LP61_9DINO|nr:unnamed protein product [Symbiodinium natans]